MTARLLPRGIHDRVARTDAPIFRHEQKLHLEARVCSSCCCGRFETGSSRCAPDLQSAQRFRRAWRNLAHAPALGAGGLTSLRVRVPPPAFGRSSVLRSDELLEDRHATRCATERFRWLDCVTLMPSNSQCEW